MRKQIIAPGGGAGAAWSVAYLIIFSLFLSSFSLSAQRNLTLFNLSATPQSYQQNPGRFPLSNFYVSVPLIGSINAGYANTSFSFGDLNLNGGEVDTIGEEIEKEDFFSNDFAEFLDLLGDRNRFLTEFSVMGLEVGFRLGKKNFINLQVADHAFFQVDYPRELFTLFDDVSNEVVDNNAFYDLSALHFNAMHYRSYGIGATRQFNPRFSAGGRAKLLVGLGNLTTVNRNLAWVNDSTSNTFAINGAFGWFGSGIQLLGDDPSTYLRGSSNLGFAFDLGLQFLVTPKLELSASVLNVGAINWETDLTLTTFSNADVTFSSTDIDDFSDATGELIDSLTTGEPLSPAPYGLRIPMQANLGLNYYLNNKTSVGLLVAPRIYQGEIDWAIAGNLQTRLNKILQAQVNVSTLNRTGVNVGLGLAAELGPVQIYLASDNVLSVINPTNTRSAHIHAGINLNFGRKTREERLAEWAHPTDSTALAVALPVDSSLAKTKTKEKDPTQPSKAEGKKPEKAQGQSSPAQPATAPAAAALKPTVDYKAEVLNAESKEVLLSVLVEVYLLADGRAPQLVLSRSFYNDNIGATLQRDQTYRIVFKKTGFATKEVVIGPAEMSGKAMIKEEYLLGMAPVAPPVVATAGGQKPATALAANASNQPLTTLPSTGPSAGSPGRILGIFAVVEAGVIKEQPATEAADVFRLVPGYRVSLLEKTNNDWWKIAFRDFVGYYPAKFLVVER